MLKYILAHRGYSAVSPESTSLAFDAALLFGFDGVDIDIHKTKDNHLVIIHDTNIKRTSNYDGKELVKDMSLKELEKFNLTHKFNDKFPFQKIMTLDLFLEKYGNIFKFLSIELKTNNIEYKNIEELVNQTLNKYTIKADILLSSFNINTLIRLRQANKKIKLGYVFSKMNDLKKNIEEVKKNCSYICVDKKLFKEKEYIDFFAKLDLDIAVWTFDNSKHKTKKEIKESDDLFEKVSKIEKVKVLISKSKY
jgi:glycerophosphoryl diester phosphodiesterase